jgi:hypothetical protein
METRMPWLAYALGKGSGKLESGHRAAGALSQPCRLRDAMNESYFELADEICSHVH